MYDERRNRFNVESDMIMVVKDDELGPALEQVDKRIQEAAALAAATPVT